MDAAPTDDRLFRAVFEGTLDALLLTDDDGTYVEANEAATELFDCSREALIGRSIDEFVPPEFDFQRSWERFLEEGEMRGTFELHRPDGETRSVEFAASARISPGVHLSAIRDVTQRERARIELTERTEMLTKVFEASPVGILVVDADGQVAEANDRAAAVLGFEREEITDRTYDDPGWAAVDESGTPLSSSELPVGKALETGEPIFEFEHGIEGPNGETRWLSVNAAPIYGADDSVTQVVATVSDVTDRREYRRMLEQQNRRLEEYSATVSHDLRSPLSVASGWLGVAMQEGSTEYLEKVETALDRMDELISDLRALGRCGQTVEGMVELQLGSVVSEAWSNVETADATLDIEGDLGTIEGEHGRLLQLFENLFRNAVEHAGRDTTVRVGSLDRGFYVEDDGPGIPEDERENVFEFGYSTVEGETGLGLAIVDAVADAHGWEHRLADADPQGARFEFRTGWHPDRDDPVTPASR